VDLPALESGQLVLVHPREGKLVKLGEPLAQINDQMPKRALEEATLKHQIATEKANDVTDIDSAEKKLALATSELERNATLRPRGSVTEFEYQRTRYTRDIANLEFIAATRDKRLAAVEAQTEMVKVNAANDSIARHLLTSPFDGNVLEVRKHAGEWVNAGETVLRVARMDKLRAIGSVDALTYDPHEVDGKRITVTVQLAHERVVELPGRIVYASLERRLGTGTDYEVWAEVDNQMENGHWLLQADAKVTMRIFLK
jgi:multidrug resistance efflux pump